MNVSKEKTVVNSTSGKKMLIGLHLGNGYGSQPGAWRMPGVNPQNYTSFDARVKQAQSAERGKFQFINVNPRRGGKGN